MNSERSNWKDSYKIRETRQGRSFICNYHISALTLAREAMRIAPEEKEKKGWELSLKNENTIKEKQKWKKY